MQLITAAAAARATYPGSASAVASTLLLSHHLRAPRHGWTLATRSESDRALKTLVKKLDKRCQEDVDLHHEAVVLTSGIRKEMYLNRHAPHEHVG